MAFYEEPQTGDFLPYIGFNAKSDKWFVKVGTEKVALKGEIAFVVDFKNLKTGWMLFADGLAPNKVYDPSIEEKAAQPSPKHKRGVEFNVYMKGTHEGVYSFSTVAGNVLKPFSELHDKYLEEIKTNPDFLPVVVVGESQEVKSSFKNPDGSQGTATNYMPSFKIEKFVKRPAVFDETATQPEPVKAQSSVSEF